MESKSKIKSKDCEKSNKKMFFDQIFFSRKSVNEFIKKPGGLPGLSV